MTDSASSTSRSSRAGLSRQHDDPHRSSTLVLVVAIGVVAAALTFLRMTPETAATLWAEDGRDFIADRAASSFGVTWLQPYAGYLHLVPRILADLTVTFIPSPWWAWSMSAGSALVVGLVSSYAFVITRHLLTWIPARIMLALVPALTPILVDQVIGNAANLHTYFLWLTPFLFFARPRTRWARVVLVVVMLAATLTEIQALIFAPLVLWRVRDRSGWPVRAAYLVGLAGQGLCSVLFKRVPYADAPTPGLQATVEGFLANGVGGTFTADWRVVGGTILASGWLVFLIIGAVILAALVVVVVRARPEQRLLGLVLAYGAIASFALGYLLNPLPGLDYATYSPEIWASTFRFLRYGAPSAMFLLTIVVLTAGVLAERGRRVLPVILIAALLVIFVMGFRSSTSDRHDGPTWRAEHDRAVATCVGADPATTVLVPIPPGWDVALRCSDLD